MTCVHKEYEVRMKMVYTGAMNTAKNAVFIYENCYLVGANNIFAISACEN